MKISKIFCLLAFLTISLPIFAQTNIYYQAKQIEIEFAPTISASSLENLTERHTYGYSLESTYWQTESTGTSLEIGTYDYNNYNLGIIDHMGALETLRISPLKNTDLERRFAVEVRTGATTYLLTGSKSIDIGFGLDYSLTKKVRIEGDITTHFLTVQTKNGTTLRIGLQWIF